ncbi:MAG TPA: hypothetical protein VES02_00140 [Dermatophilaceae bacterium]|nr:hypothetical protein [Dermatophilaceae bacterium]
MPDTQFGTPGATLSEPAVMVAELTLADPADQVAVATPVTVLLV